MIVHKEWKKTSYGGITIYVYEGWFLFGIIPIYIRRYGAK
jgi:hypothetical protein